MREMVWTDYSSWLCMPRVRLPVLLVTGSGKTPKTRHVIEAAEQPTLVLASNKTLALEFQAAVRLYDEIAGIRSTAFGIVPRKAVSGVAGPLAPLTALLLP